MMRQSSLVSKSSKSLINCVFLSSSWGALFLLLSSACVTVNVNFPESVVQKAADDYVRELYGDEKNKKSVEKGRADQSFLPWFIASPAQAAEVDISFKTNTPNILEVQGRQKSRLKQLDSLKKEGVIGESKDGFLVLRKEDGLMKLRKKQAEKLISDENADRGTLYQEILTANSMTEDKADMVKSVFSGAFQKSSPAGTEIQTAEGTWVKK